MSHCSFLSQVSWQKGNDMLQAQAHTQSGICIISRVLVPWRQLSAKGKWGRENERLLICCLGTSCIQAELLVEATGIFVILFLFLMLLSLSPSPFIQFSSPGSISNRWFWHIRCTPMWSDTSWTCRHNLCLSPGIPQQQHVARALLIVSDDTHIH